MSATPAELLTEASTLLAEDDPATRGRWGRIATHLTRQALETSLRAYWGERHAGLASANFRTQFICLAEYHPDRALVRRVAWAWEALSDAGHARGALPGQADLEDWIRTVAAFGATVPTRPAT